VQEANLKHAINGYLYCNGPELQLKEGRPVRLILAAFGGEKDMHTPVFRNQVGPAPSLPPAVLPGLFSFSNRALPPSCLCLHMLARKALVLSGRWLVCKR
jgi:hypothetical protein